MSAYGSSSSSGSSYRAYRSFRSKRLGLPAAYAVAALLAVAALYRIFRSPVDEAAIAALHGQPSHPVAPVTEAVDAKLSDIIAKARHELEAKEGRTAGSQELLRKVQAEVNRRQLGLEIKDYEGTGGHRHDRVSQAQLLSLPKPYRLEKPDVLLRPRFQACQKDKEPLFLVLVHTRAAEIAYRNAIRETWYSPTKSHTKFINTRPHLWRVVFTTGSGRGANLQREIEEEAKEFGDILQFRFLDTVHSGQRKTMGALLEFSEDDQLRRCQPKFLLKVTDDTFVNMPAFVHWLAAKFPANKRTGLYVGHTVHGDVPDRNPQRVGYVSETDYPFSAYPDYNKNPAYLISWDLVPRLAGEIVKLQPISVDDAYIGILMARLGVRPLFNDHFVMLEGPMDVCMHLRMFFISHLPPVEVLNVFERNSQGRRLNECKDVLPYQSDHLDL